ncbi:hypothetical protein NC652_003801 [Populus alba x Populus x berolinensis]|nr:hypothetical protein NC652_003801 [Populus alba x Populus x berolinensis]
MQKQEKVSKDVLTDCTTCTLYPYPCQPLAPPPPPPVPDYPSYGTPPPPLAGYVSSPSQANCPPVPVQCCQPPPSLCLCISTSRERFHVMFHYTERAPTYIQSCSDPSDTLTSICSADC